MTAVNAVPKTGPHDALFLAAAKLADGSVSLPLYHLLRIVSFRESAWKADAKNPTSSARGLFQTTGQAIQDYNRVVGAKSPQLVVNPATQIFNPDIAVRVGRWMLGSIMSRLSAAGMDADLTNPDFVGATLAGFVLSPYGIPAAARAVKARGEALTLRNILHESQRNARIKRVTDDAHLRHIARMVNDMQAALAAPTDSASEPVAEVLPPAVTNAPLSDSRLLATYDSLARRAILARETGKLPQRDLETVLAKRTLLRADIEDGKLNPARAAFYDSWASKAGEALSGIETRAKWGAGGLIAGALLVGGLALAARAR